MILEMKKSIALLLLIVSLVLLVGCIETKKDDAKPDFTFDESGQYTGFKALPADYTIEDATKDGYLVSKNLNIIANEALWTNFVETSSKGKNTNIRMVKFFTTESSLHPFYTDVFYEDGFYYSFDSSAPVQEKEPYKYLLTLDGNTGNPLRNSGLIVLSNDQKLTFDQIMRAMISSNMSVIESTPKHQILMFK